MNLDKTSQLIKKLRKDNNLTQSQFAEKFGVTYQAVSKWENAKNIPDIAIIKQICKEYNIDINDLLEGNKKENFKKYIIIGLLLTFSIIIIIMYNFFYNKNYEFKTISSNCDNFNINGVIAYNKNKSSIYISSIDYCGDDDNTKYKNIECNLYEVTDKVEIKIDECKNDIKNDIKLIDYLKGVEFNIDNYLASCNDFKHSELRLKINATDDNDKTTLYYVPIKFNDKCDNSTKS